MEILEKIIEGFESPLGMELLATVDMILMENKETRFNLEAVLKEIENWNERKATLMKPEYVKATMNRLKEFQEYLYS